MKKKAKLDKNVEGDVGRVFTKKEGTQWKSELFTAFLMEGLEATFDFNLHNGSFVTCMKRFLNESRLSQGYIVCTGGLLNDLRCGFFLTKHKPLPAFAEAFFPGENKVLNINGLFLTIPKLGSKQSPPSVVPHLHVTFQDTRICEYRGGHLIDAESGALKCSVVPLSGVVLGRD